MRSFALLAEQAEELDWFSVGRAEPVRHPGVELGGFAGREHEVVLAEDDPEPPVEYVEPLVPLMGPRLGFGALTRLDH